MTTTRYPGPTGYDLAVMSYYDRMFGSSDWRIPPAGGFLRALDIRVTGSYTPPYVRPRAAAARTRSRRRLAGSRWARRHGVPPRGRSGGPAQDWPFNLMSELRLR